MVNAVYRIKWTEHERGWGSSSMGHTDYATFKEAEEAIKDHWADYPDGPTPDYYISPSKPYLVEKENDA